ncbi:signal transduction histidine kinase/CheY-like chemotaxis protein [Neorhizobium sp. 2083]|uniref:response regulator n=1 Tax=Neorhizobium sp. 2083 TaxID=2817762 RepID=UPI002858C55A|nr:response regulator [Neorhizobium sp. 2083]MDR6819981.1 signal transduction histidine kinase/CheY-like chemotaxis protein [Neorhizobium sp. 2083]
MGWFIINKQQAEIDASVKDRAGLLSGALQRELDTQLQLLALVAESPRMDLPVSKTSFGETARRITTRLPNWEQVRVTNEDGEVVLAFPPLLPSASRKVIDQESHEQVFRTNTGVIGNVVVGARGRAAFAVRVPIERGDRVRAVLSVVIRPAMITLILQRSGLPKNWSAWVVDSRDRLVSATDGPGFEGRPSAEFAQAKGSGRFDVQGIGSLHTAEASLSGIPWRVRVGLPSAEYERPAQQATLLLVLASGAIICLCATASFLFYREMQVRAAEQESLANWQRMDALGKLTGQAAHDFNNLLMVFQSGVEGIERRRNDEERVTRLLGHMKEGLSRGKSITRRLLSFARRSNQGAEHIELGQKLEEMSPLLKQALNDSIAIEIRLPDDLWPIQVDPAGLEIAMINLLTNAREAMAVGGLVTITARNIPEAAFEDKKLKGPMVALTVTDTGSGIATSDIERVFEPFFSTKADGGPGLGLTQVHGFVTSCGGLIKAASLQGHGSAFTLLIPRSNAIGEASDGSLAHRELPDCILIVDDTPASLESARLALEGLVPTLFTAGNGVEALEILKRETGIRGVISDIMMPGMSGIDLADELAKTHPELSVVLMTGYSDRLEAGAEVAIPVLMKPFTQKDLVAAFLAVRSSKADYTNVIRLERLSQIEG